LLYDPWSASGLTWILQFSPGTPEQESAEPKIQKSSLFVQYTINESSATPKLFEDEVKKLLEKVSVSIKRRKKMIFDTLFFPFTTEEVFS
jgi:hypothetical protein